MPRFDEGFRLSHQQRDSWLADRTSGETRVAARIDFDGALEAETLKVTLETLTGRHEILRTRFLGKIGLKVPLQVIDEDTGIQLREDDLSKLNENELVARLEELFDEELQRPFDPEKGPVMAARWLRWGADVSSLLVSLPTLCGDAASLVELAEEIAALVDGTRAEELEEPLQYVDYCDWQEEIRSSEEPGPAQGRKFWQRRIKTLPRGPSLPFAHPGERTRAEWLEAVTLSLEGLRESFAARANELAATPTDLLRGAWWTLLGRLSGQEELVVGELFSGRDDEDLASGVGPFAKLIPLTCRFEGELRFAQALERLAGTRREAAGWQALFAFDEQEAEGLTAALTLGFEALPAPAVIDGKDTRLKMRRLVSSGGPTQLKLVSWAPEDKLPEHAELRFNPAMFDRAEIETLARRFKGLLSAALEDPQIRLRRLPLLVDGERESLIEGFGRGKDLQVSGDRVHHRIEAWAARTPEAPALRVEDTEISYGELDRQANRLAHHLRALGVDTDIPVALYLERSPALMIGMLGILKAGGAYVTIDTSQPQRRIAMMLESLVEPVVVTQSSLAPDLAELTSPVVILDRVPPANGEHEETRPPSRALPESLAYVVFTSGSTGRPKGVGVEHRQLVSYLDGVSERLGLEPGASFASVSTFAADLGHTSVFGALTRGGCLHLITQERATDPHGLAEYFERHPVDCLKIVPSHLEALQAGAQPARLLPRRCLVVGGESSKRPWGQGLLKLAGDRRILNHYGPSETTVGISTFTLNSELDPRCMTVPIGRPIANNRAYLLGSRGEPVPPWLPGELYLGGTNVTRGYVEGPSLTAEHFVPDPFADMPGSRLYRTGDLARALPGGEIEFLGRRDHQVKFHGFRVELGEIRHALNSHPQVRDSVVRLTRDKGGLDLLVAYYVSRHEIAFGELREHLATSILEEILPNLFVHLRRLPLTLNGKINHQALPSVEEARSKIERPFVEPRNETEQRVAQIWAEILPPEKVSVEDNFFELGGHSLLATRIVARIREQLGADVPLKTLFETPTVAALAQHIEKHSAKEEDFQGLHSTGGGDLMDQLDEIEGLSGGEVGRLLEQEEKPPKTREGEQE